MARFGAKDAMRNHMLSGNAITKLEALLLFGVQNPVTEIYRMKKDGYLIGSQKVPMVKITARVNKYAILELPEELPQKEIMITEYWVKS